MLNASEVNAIVHNAVGDGVHMAFLTRSASGVLLSSRSTLDADDVFHVTVAAVQNMWRLYVENDLTINEVTCQQERDSLEQLLLDLGDKKICCMAVGAADTVIALVAFSPEMELGMLKLRTAAVQRALDAILP